MLDFKYIREAAKDNSKPVLRKKLMGVPVKITTGKRLGRTYFDLYIDGEKLAQYDNQNLAMKTAKEFVKQYRKSKWI